MSAINRWPQSNALECGCRVALKQEGPIDVLMYFPCRSDCPTVELTKQKCEEVGKPWEVRNASHN